MDKLSKDKRDEIDAILCQAQETLNTGDKEYSAKLANQAWGLLPDPKFEWDVSKSFAHAVAELYRDSGKFSAALNIMNDLFSSGTVKPYQDAPHFILGTIYFEMGELKDAKTSLIKANEISKGRCFNDQPDKYKNIL